MNGQRIPVAVETTFRWAHDEATGRVVAELVSPERLLQGPWGAPDGSPAVRVSPA